MQIDPTSERGDSIHLSSMLGRGFFSAIMNRDENDVCDEKSTFGRNGQYSKISLKELNQKLSNIWSQSNIGDNEIASESPLDNEITRCSSVQDAVDLCDSESIRKARRRQAVQRCRMACEKTTRCDQRLAVQLNQQLKSGKEEGNIKKELAPPCNHPSSPLRSMTPRQNSAVTAEPSLLKLGRPSTISSVQTASSQILMPVFEIEDDAWRRLLIARRIAGYVEEDTALAASDSMRNRESPQCSSQEFIQAASHRGACSAPQLLRIRSVQPVPASHSYYSSLTLLSVNGEHSAGREPAHGQTQRREGYTLLQKAFQRQLGLTDDSTGMDGPVGCGAALPLLRRAGAHAHACEALVLQRLRRLDELRCRAAAAAIQRCWRRRRRAADAACSPIIVSRRPALRHAAAAILQRAFRAVRHRRACAARRELAQRRQAASTAIQSRWRGIWARQAAAAVVARRAARRAAVVLQRVWRGRAARRGLFMVGWMGLRDVLAMAMEEVR
jgi:hypothetical protein